MPSHVTITGLFVYPIKGARGFSPTAWPVGERGLWLDRRWMVVDDEGICITQRDVPALARLHTTFDEDALIVHGGATARVPLFPLGPRRAMVRVWDDSFEATFPAPEADTLISEFLGRSCRLAFMPDNADRLTAAKRGVPQRQMNLADCAPALLVAETALDELNERLQRAGASPVPMTRLRPNITVRGNARGDDDRWTHGVSGHVAFRFSTACKRCQVITIDQASGQPSGPEPLRTLAEYRRDGDGVVFGRHVLFDSPGELHVGETIRVEAFLE